MKKLYGYLIFFVFASGCLPQPNHGLLGSWLSDKVVETEVGNGKLTIIFTEKTFTYQQDYDTGESLVSDGNYVFKDSDLIMRALEHSGKEGGNIIFKEVDAVVIKFTVLFLSPDRIVMKDVLNGTSVTLSRK